jgi:uncharacterized protein (TIGR02271 family)
MLNYQSDICEGMKVRASDGDRLGKVVSMQDGGFVIEKGLFFPKDYFVTYESVSDIRDGEIWLATTAEQLRTSGVLGEEHVTGTGILGRADDLHNRSDVYARDSGERLGDVTAERRDTLIGAEGTEERSLPLYAEELEVQKRQRQAGEVNISKEVVTEQKTVTVPVRREEVHVEEVAASGGIVPDDIDLERGETISVPVMEEEVEITKRPVKKGEVRVTKTATEEQRTVSAEVKEEKAKIDRDTDLLDDEHRRIPH